MKDNGLMIRCTKCGTMNQLPVVHCKRCGARLDFEAAEGRILRESQRGAHSSLAAGVRLVLAAALILVLVLILWPGEMTRTTGEAMDARRYRLKGEMLIDALNRGVPGLQTIQEKEINAYLRETVAAQPPPKGKLSSVVADAAVRLVSNQAEGFIAVQRGPLTFTGHFLAQPEGGKLVVTGAKAGHLPLPGILGRLYARTIGGVFRQMKNEGRILRNLDGIVVQEGAVELLTKAGG